MKINIHDGSITFANGSMSRTTQRAEFLASPLGRSAKAKEVGISRFSYDFDPEFGISATATFHGDRLDRLFLMMKLPSDAAGQWTEALETVRKARHDHWISDELGPGPHKYEWGSVNSDFDPRGCASEIILVYER